MKKQMCECQYCEYIFDEQYAEHQEVENIICCPKCGNRNVKKIELPVVGYDAYGNPPCQTEVYDTSGD